MDTFEKELAKKQLETLRSINRNLTNIGRKLEETNRILAKNGFAVLPTETDKPEESD